MQLLYQLIAFFEHQPAVFIGYCCIIGLLVGSFLNVVIYRLPLMMHNSWLSNARQFISQSEQQRAEQNQPRHEHTNASAVETFNLVHPNSHCPQCKNPVKIWQNIPVISYLLLAGRCAHCREKISLRYPSIELICAVLSGYAAVKFGVSWSCLVALLFIWGLISLTMIDFDHQLLPDDITLPLLWLGLIANSFSLFTSLHNALWGAVIGYLSLWSIFWIFKLLTSKEGMGYGDFKLLAALGALLGWQLILPIILIASISGTVIGLLLILRNARQAKNNQQVPLSQPFAFGPYLAIGGLICLFFSDPILIWLGLG